MFPNISAELARNKITTERLSKILGVTRKTVSNWLNGKTEIPASKIIKLAEILECTTDYLLGVRGNGKSA